MAKALKSQLESLTGKVPTAAPQSALARFIAGELKGGEVKHNFAMSVVRSAVEQAFKGNTRDIPEAIRLCQGKAVKAKAYAAGFHAIADMVEPVKYTGKLDSKENTPVREQIAQFTEASMLAFEKDYLDVFAMAKAEAADKKAAKAAEAEAAKGSASAPAGEGETAPVLALTVDVPDVAANIDIVTNAIRMGLLSVEELALVRGALAMFDEHGASQPEALAA